MLDVAHDVLRVGWCPGALRPMMAGDGLLARVKPRGHRLSIDQARGIADAAARYGNGVLTLTGRANIQVRGLGEEGLAGAVAMLDGLGLLDADAAGEAARNLVSSPLAGSAFPAAFDIRPAVAALEEALSREAVFQSLPAKFAWVVDDGGALDLSAITADVRCLAVNTVDGPRFRIALPGKEPAGWCAAADLVPAARALAEAFVGLCGEHGLVPRRLRDLCAVVGTDRVLQRAGLPIDSSPPTVRSLPAPIGFLCAAKAQAVGIAPPFGRLEAAGVAAIAEAAARAGATDLRLTPWRSLLVTGIGAPADLLRVAKHLGFIVDPADPRLAVVACAGQPACRRAEAPVQAHAARLAPLLGGAGGSVMRLHLSGCSKGCAHPGVATITAVAREKNYDIVRDGRAGDAPMAAGLSLAALAALVAQDARAVGEAG